MKDIIETERLIIRHPRPEDSESCFKNFMHDKHLLQFQDCSYYENLDDATFFFDYCSRFNNVCLLDNDWILELKDTHIIIGNVSYAQDLYPHRCGVSINWTQ